MAEMPEIQERLRTLLEDHQLLKDVKQLRKTQIEQMSVLIAQIVVMNVDGSISSCVRVDDLYPDV